MNFLFENTPVLEGLLLIRSIAISILLLPLAAFAGYQGEDESTILARIGPHTITVQEYLERLDLVPWPGKDNPELRDSAKINALSSLVAEKLLSLQAVEQGITSREITARTLHSLKRLFARDELYREEVFSQVDVTPEEIADGVERFAFVLTLNSYIMKSERDAHGLAGALNTDRTVVMPHDGIVSHDTITIRFGDLKEAPERQAFAIDSVGQAIAFNSPGEGWLVLQLLEKDANDAYLKAGGFERQATVKRLIRQRKEGELTARYLRGVFTQSVKLDSAAFHRIANNLRTIMIADSVGRWEQGVITVHPQDADSLKKMLAPVLKQPAATMAGYTVSSEELIDEFSYWPVRFSSLQRVPFLRTLNQSIQSLVEAGIISDEAVNRHMNERSGVQRDIRVWSDAVQADKMLRYLVDSLAGAMDSGATGARTLDPSIDPTLRASDMMDSYLATLAEKYDVELRFDQLKSVQINPHNMVTKRFIGFGGVTMGAPMIMRLWNWIHEWENRKKSHP